jgi:hypothetical protein
MTTATQTPSRNGSIFAAEPPQFIRAALEAVVMADRGLWADRQALKRRSTEAARERIVESAGQLDAVTDYATRLLEDFLGGRTAGYWPIAGRLVGFSPVSKYGMTLAVKADRSQLKGAGR